MQHHSLELKSPFTQCYFQQEQDEHDLQAVRGERGAVRQAHQLPVLPAARSIRGRQVHAVLLLLQAVRPAQNMLTVQTEVCFRQRGEYAMISRENIYTL